jgi:hypothetical protein
MNLREKLSSLTQLGAEHVPAVIAVSDECSHSIVPLHSDVELSRYTCLVYALGFAGKTEYEDIAGLPHVNVFAGKKFANWLLANGHLQPLTQTEIPEGAFAIYLDPNGEFLHIGICTAEMRLNSKWGTQGLYNHSLLEVPESYGSSINYFEAIDYLAAIELFKDFAALNGVVFEST